LDQRSDGRLGQVFGAGAVLLSLSLAHSAARDAGVRAWLAARLTTGQTV
jgi:hypothetical protein